VLRPPPEFHHDPVRHADGGKEMKIVHSDCHKELHGCGSWYGL